MRLSWLEPPRKVANVYEATLHRFLNGGSGCVEVSLHWAGRSLAACTHFEPFPCHRCNLYFAQIFQHLLSLKLFNLAAGGGGGGVETGVVRLLLARRLTLEPSQRTASSPTTKSKPLPASANPPPSNF